MSVLVRFRLSRIEWKNQSADNTILEGGVYGFVLQSLRVNDSRSV